MKMKDVCVSTIILKEVQHIWNKRCFSYYPPTPYSEKLHHITLQMHSLR